LILPAPGASDVVSRELTVRIGTGEPMVAKLQGDVLVYSGYEGNDGDAVEGQLVDIDDAGNRSEARTFSFVLADTIAPAQPGEVGLKVTGET
jgi:hypothetical protein